MQRTPTFYFNIIGKVEFPNNCNSSTYFNDLTHSISIIEKKFYCTADWSGLFGLTKISSKHAEWTYSVKFCQSTGIFRLIHWNVTSILNWRVNSYWLLGYLFKKSIILLALTNNFSKK